MAIFAFKIPGIPLCMASGVGFEEGITGGMRPHSFGFGTELTPWPRPKHACGVCVGHGSIRWGEGCSHLDLPTVNKVPPLNILFFCSGVWAVRAQGQDSVNAIVQPRNPIGGYVPSGCREARGSPAESPGIRRMYGCVVQGPVGMPRLKEPKTKCVDGVIAQQ